MIISVFDRVENIVGKGEKAVYQHFLYFPQCFEKASFSDTSKGVIVWESVNVWFSQSEVVLHSNAATYRKIRVPIHQLFPRTFFFCSSRSCKFESNNLLTD